MTRLRFWAFAYDDHYPSGGIGDRIGMFPSIEDARTAIKNYPWRDNREIVDTETGEVVKDDVK